jgi:hypothetical protein
MKNPDIPNGLINPTGSHTSQLGTSSNSVGGRRRRTKLMRRHKRKHTKKYKSRRMQRSRSRSRRSRRQRGGINPTYRAYSASFEPGQNGMYANGPSVGNIIEQFN